MATIEEKKIFIFINSAAFLFLSFTSVCFGQSNWEPVPLTADNTLHSVTYGNGLFVAVGGNQSQQQGIILSSSDGKTWTNASISNFSYSVSL